MGKKRTYPWRECLANLIEKHGEGGSYLRGLRYREGLTQKVLAQKIGIHQTHISEMENKKRPIGKAMAKRLAIALNGNYRCFL